MTTSPYIQATKQLLAANARPWENPEHCRAVIKGLRADGEQELAAQLEQAMQKPQPFWGSTAR
jgi:hypothetical protein